MKFYKPLLFILVALGVVGVFSILRAEASEQTIGSEDGKVSVRRVVESDEIPLSGSVRMMIEVHADADTELAIPDLGESYGHFKVVSTETHPTVLLNERISQRRYYELEPSRAGEETLPPILLTVSQGEKKDSLLLPAGKIRVVSPNDPDKVSLDSLTPASKRTIWRHILRGFLIALMISAALLGAFLLIRKFPRGRSVPKEPVLSPSQRALRAIEMLLLSKIYETDVRQFYLTLTGIVRRYIEETTGLRAPEQTTEEFLRDAQKCPLIAQEEHQKLASFLEFSDLVKFAKFEPTYEEILSGADRARSFCSWNATSVETNETNESYQS